MAPMIINPDFHHVHFLLGEFLNVAPSLVDGVYFPRYAGVARKHGGIAVLSGESTTGSEHGCARGLIRFSRPADFKHGLEIGPEAQNSGHSVTSILPELSENVFLGVVL